jgi:hypothetical protein
MCYTMLTACAVSCISYGLLPNISNTASITGCSAVCTVVCGELCLTGHVDPLNRHLRRLQGFFDEELLLCNPLLHA